MYAQSTYFLDAPVEKLAPNHPLPEYSYAFVSKSYECNILKASNEH
jgi:hypothetical protein